MIKWLKKKIEIHNNNLDYGNYENHWEFGEWIYFVLIAFFFPIGLSIFICYIENSWLPFFVGVNITVIIEYGLCCQIDLFSKNTNKIQDIEEEFDPYHIDDLEFIWGVKSWDDFTSPTPNLHTMNDLSIIYNKKTKIYSLGIETAYHFNNGKVGEVKYLKELLEKFTTYMQKNNFAINIPYTFWFSQVTIPLEADTIAELYTQFRIFVEGYNAVYGGKENEVICDI